MSEERLREYAQEGLFVQRCALYKRYLNTGGEQINFPTYLQREFQRDAYLQERVGERHGECERGRCTLVRERKGQAFWTFEDPPQMQKVTGDVYVCVDSGALHVCTSDLCETRTIPDGGFATVCKLTCRVHDDDRLMVSEGQRLGEYHVLACNSGAGYQPDNGNPILQGPSYNVFDSKTAYRREARLVDKRLARYSERIVNAGDYSEAAQGLNDAFLREASNVHSKTELEALCKRYESKALPAENNSLLSRYTDRIATAGKCKEDAKALVQKFLAETKKYGLTRTPKDEGRLEELCEQYSELARLRSVWRQQGRAVYQNEVLSSTAAQELLLRGETAMSDFKKACREYTKTQMEQGLALDVRVYDDLHLEHKCKIHARIRERVGVLEKIDAFKQEAEEEVVSLVVDIWSALHDLEATRAKTLEFRTCVLAILGYMSGSHANFIESLSGGRYGTGGGEPDGGLRQLVKVDRKTGLAHRVESDERPSREIYDVRVVTFVPCVPSLRLGPISSGSIVYDARKAEPSESKTMKPRTGGARATERHLDGIVANMKPSEKKKNARKDVIPGFAPPLNDFCSEDRCVDLILAASKRVGVNAKNIKNVEQRSKAKSMLKCRQLASGAGRMTSKKNLHRIVSSLLNGSLRWEELEKFNFVVSERLLRLHDKYRLYQGGADEE